MTSSARRPLTSAGLRVAITITTVVVILAAVVVTTPGTDRARPATVTPTLAQMNAAGDHVLGAAVAGRGRHTGLEPVAALFPPGIPGLDVSGWQPDINWAQVASDGAKFAYVKATEGADYTSSQYPAQWAGSARAGLLRGAYHFAIPSASSGGDQARYFLTHGGTWTGDGKTLPPLLDIEYNPNGSSCYGLTPAQMVTWIADFTNTVAATVGRLPALYTTTAWWSACTGNSPAFAALPLVIAKYPDSLATGTGALPAGWGTHTIWQYNDHGTFPGDQDTFNGTIAQLTAFALGPAKPKPALTSKPVVSPAALTAQPTAAGADFNGDSIPDLITRRPDGTVWLYVGVGSDTASWRGGQEIATGWNQYDTILSIGDLTGDGDNDLIARRSDGTLWLYPGTGTAGGMNSVFGKPVKIGAGWNQYRQLIAAGDVNNDGHPDLLGLKPNGNLWLFNGTNDSALTAAAQVPGDFTATQLVGAGDINGDKRPDLVAAHADGSVWLYRGRGNDTWLPPMKVPGLTVTPGSILIPVGDTNGDHRSDLLQRATDGTLHLLTGDDTPQQAFTGSTSVATAAGATQVLTGDVTGDHRPDLITVTTLGAVQISAATPTTGYQPAKTVIPSGLNGLAAIAAGDATVDGVTDLVAIANTGAAWLYTGDGHGSFAPRVRVGDGMTGVVAAAIADVDGDHRGDLLTQTSSGALIVYPGITPSAGDPSRFATGTRYGDGLDAYRPGLAAVDANGDGIIDLVTSRTDGTLWLATGARTTGDGHFNTPVKLGSGWAPYSTIVSAADPRAGHASDVLAATKTGAVSVFSGTNVAGIPGGILTDTGTVGDKLAIFR